MYQILKSTSKMLAVFSVVGLVLGASVNADARDATMDRTSAPEGIAVNELLGMEVRSSTGEELASVDDVFLNNGRIMEVVLDYEGDLVAVPIQDLRFTDRNHIVYEGTRSTLEAARDRYAYGKGPFVYPKGTGYEVDRRAYYGSGVRYGSSNADVRYGTGLRDDRAYGNRNYVYSGPDAGGERSYGAQGYGAEPRYGTKLDEREAYIHEDQGYMEGDRRTYYDRPYTREYYGRTHEGSRVYSGAAGYGDKGYGAEPRYGTKLERDRYILDDEGYVTEEQRGYYERGDADYGFRESEDRLHFGPK